jgi:type IV pilus assembly protein PilP
VPALIVVASLLAACGGDEHNDLKEWMADNSKDLKGRVQALPQIKTFPVVAYESGSLIDPFSSTKIAASKSGGSSNGIQPDMNRRREPLEAYSLETLKMVGILQSKGRPVAIIAADKTLYQVMVGNYMGQNFGVVTKITENDVTLKELIEDTNGDWVERMSTLQLQEQEAKK